jgi:ADP-heptose:LPS heptosyltransferase
MKSSRNKKPLHFLSQLVSQYRPLSLPLAFDMLPVKVSNGGRVLVIMLTHLGDVVINLFVIDAIAAFTGARSLDIVVRPPLEQLVLSHPGVRKVIPFACPWMSRTRWPRGIMEWFKTIRRLRGDKYDLAVVTHAHELSSLTARLSGSKVTTGWAFPGDRFLNFPLYLPKEPDRHASMYGIELLQFMGVPTVPTSGQLPVCSDDFSAGRILLEKVRTNGSGPESLAVVIHPGAGGLKKIWPKENFIAVIRQLLARNHTVLLVGTGSAESEICADIQQAFPGPKKPKNFCGQLNIGELSGIISACDIFIGHDSGPSHMAAALGIKSCAIFGPSDPAVWGPRGPGVRILHLGDGEFRSPESIKRVMSILTELMYEEQGSLPS